MTFDKRLLVLLQRGLLTCALIVPTALTGCGEDPAVEQDDDSANPDDEVPDDEVPDDETAIKDAGGAVKRDAAVKPTPTSDAGVTKDAGPIVGLDGGGGGKDGGGSTVNPGPVTGPAPTTATASTMGPYTIKTYTSGYPDAPEYLDSTMHYPEGVAGPLPAIAIVPGFLSAQSTIQKWGPFLASHGIITLTIGTNTPVDQPDARATALWGAIATLKGENTREGSPIKGKVDTSRLAVGGWSMGGGGVLITLSAHPELKAGIAFCPWSPGATFPKITTPTLFLAAKNDQLAAGQSQPFYESIPAATPKMIYERANADHFMNDPSYEMGAQGRYGLSWLKVYLEGDDRYKQFLLEKAPNASDFRTNVK